MKQPLTEIDWNGLGKGYGNGLAEPPSISHAERCAQGGNA